MSFLAGEWAEDHAPVVDTYERVILMKLARHAKDDGTAAYPYVSSLARAALCDEETVRRRLRSLQKRKLIAYGDQRLVDHYPASARPKVYDLLIPHEWFSPDQLTKVNCQRSEAQLEPLTSENRPTIAPAPPRHARADKGVPNPRRRPKTTETTSHPPLSEGGEDPVDNSAPPSERGGVDPSERGSTPPLSEGHNPSVKAVIEKSVRPETQRAPEQPPPCTDIAPDSDGRKSLPLETKTPDPERPVTLTLLEREPAAPIGQSLAAELIADDSLRHDLQRIDLLPAVKPHQRRQLEQLTTEVDRALLRFPAPQVAYYLAAKAREANTVTWLIRAFSDYSDAIKHTPSPAVDQDEESTGALLEELRNTTATAIRHELADAGEETNESGSAIEDETRKLGGNGVTTPPRSSEPVTSPVSWLTDRKFAALSPLDRAHVRAASDLPLEQLRPFAAKRIAAIRRAALGVAA